MHPFTKGLIAGASLVAMSVACGAGDDGSSSDDSAITASQIGSAFDVNDVSILFPLKGASPYPMMRVSGVGTGESALPPNDQQFLTKEVFNAVVAEAKRKALRSGFESNVAADFFAARGLWQIVALRFDPCAPGFAEIARDASPAKGKCMIQFRLVTQPFRDGQTAPDDFTMHLVFNLGTADLATLPSDPIVQGAMQMLSGIKDASAKIGAKTSGQPLGVHPGLEAEARSGGGAVGDLVKAMMKKLTATPNRQVAFMGLQNGGPEPWTFFAGQVTNNVYALIPQLPGHGKDMQTLSFVDPNGPVVQKSQLPVNTSPLFGATPTDAQRKLAFQVENSSTQHFFNTDCVSCHTSSSRIADLQLGDKAEISARVHVPKNITGYVTKGQAQDDTWNLRNFGYFGAKPTVSGRTAAETTDIVQWFNTKVRDTGGLNGPGPDCSAVDDQVWKCFRDAKDNCLATCAKPPKPDQVGPVPVRPAVPLQLDPQNPASKDDPCLNPAIGGGPTVAVQDLTVLKSVGATLGGNDSACLSRFVGGAFVSNDGIVLVCGSPTQCIITLVLDDPGQPVHAVTVQGAEAARFRQFFRVKDDQFFETRAPQGGAVRIECPADKCTVTVTDPTTPLPASALPATNRINPMN